MGNNGVADDATTLNGMNVLVTGGFGFIGAATVMRLKAYGARVRILDNLSVGQPSDLPAASALLADEAAAWTENVVHYVAGDLLDEDACTRASVGAEAIIHLAANTGVPISIENPRIDCMSNVVGTLNMLEAARANGVRRFVFASSGAPAGEVDPPIHENIVPRPISPYGASKLAGEAYCRVYNSTFGIETVALRFSNIYGPGSTRKTSVVATFCRRAVNGQHLEVYGDGGQTRDFIFIDDIVAAILRGAAAEGIGGELFQVATARETTVMEIAEKVRECCTAAGLPAPDVVTSEARQGDVRRNFSDTTKAREVLGWQAAHSLQEGVAATLQSFIDAQSR